MGSALVCVELGLGPMFVPNKFGGVGKKKSGRTGDRGLQNADDLIQDTDFSLNTKPNDG